MRKWWHRRRNVLTCCVPVERCSFWNANEDKFIKYWKKKRKQKTTKYYIIKLKKGENIFYFYSKNFLQIILTFFFVDTFNCLWKYIETKEWILRLFVNICFFVYSDLFVCLSALGSNHTHIHRALSYGEVLASVCFWSEMDRADLCSINFVPFASMNACWVCMSAVVVNTRVWLLLLLYLFGWFCYRNSLLFVGFFLLFHKN